MTGIHYFLANTPIWLTATILWFTTDGVLYLMRDKLEGLGYQVSYAAKFGDALLIVAVLIAATILQREGVYLPEWLQIWWLQLGILLVCVGIGLAVSLLTLGERSGQAGDIYHDIVIGPALLFFIITLTPVIWYNARWWEKLAAIAAALVWARLVPFYIKHKRMNQRKWLVEHGFAIKGEIPKR